LYKTNRQSSLFSFSFDGFDKVEYLSSFLIVLLVLIEIEEVLVLIEIQVRSDGVDYSSSFLIVFLVLIEMEKV